MYYLSNSVMRCTHRNVKSTRGKKRMVMQKWLDIYADSTITKLNSNEKKQG